MNSKLIGGILLMVGCTIGAGILGLPIATAELGFVGSLVLLIGGWLVITFCAFLVLEVNLRLPAGTNFISMAGATLGRWGQSVIWVIYLVLLYSFISAYIAGGGDLFHYLLQVIGFSISPGAGVILFTLLFGLIVYLGVHCIDYANRVLMCVKMGVFILLLLSIFPFISSDNLVGGDVQHTFAPSSMMVVAAAFGSLMIVPSLRTYFGEDVRSLRYAIFIGFTISLLCYIAWDMVILGVIPWQGSPGLQQMVHSSTTNSDILKALELLVHKKMVLTFLKCFTAICMTTSFLSISLCLTDFLADGLRLPKAGFSNLLIHGLTWVPPVLLVLFYPGGFMRALEYAGICVVILMVIMPPLMVWRSRMLRLGDGYHTAATNEGLA